jgi:hypothetical protein
MSNSEMPEFDYDTFDAAYKADNRISKIVTAYDDDSISMEPKKKELAPKKSNKSNSVEKAAKRAVDLKDL